MGVFAMLFALSYLFVVQPRYDPPMTDIYSDSLTGELDWSNGYILKCKDGTYYMISGGKEPTRIKSETAELFASVGTEIKEE